MKTVSKVKSAGTRRFWELFQALPSEVQDLAVKNYHLWRRNPNHPSLHFRRLLGLRTGVSPCEGENYEWIDNRRLDPTST